MADGHHRAAWAHTSHLLALTANVHRDPKKTQPFEPSDLDPTVAKVKAARPKVKLRDVKGEVMGAIVRTAKRAPRTG